MLEFGIDLGTANTVVCNDVQGIVYDQPSVLLRRGHGRRRGGVVAVGREAAELLGRVPAGVVALRPLQDGVITDLEVARAYLRAVIHRAVRSPWRRSHSRVAIGVPTGATELERRALLEAADEAGLRKTVAIDEPIAGALGCGIDPLERRVHMVVDVGGGTAEVVAFCFGGILTSRSCRVAGDEMTLAVFRHLREHHHLVVGEQTAEDAKIRIGFETEASFVVPGRDAGTGRARLVTVPVDEILELLAPIVDTIVQTLAACLDDLPPAAAGDVLADGVVAFGGAALTRSLDQRLERALGFPVKVAENPLSCVAEGASMSLRSPRLAGAFGWR
ncbi:MAG TPA: rod shape-determining protein [Kineosporiaceae bacterium]